MEIEKNEGAETPVQVASELNDRLGASSLARERAAQAWCKPTTNHLVMQPELAEAFAEILDEIWSKPWLGNATTVEMLDELRTRVEIRGRLTPELSGGRAVARTSA